MDKFSKVIKEVLKEIKPSKEEEKEVMKKIEKVLKKLNENLEDATAILGGSIAKKTWLRGIREVDLFVKFNYEKYKDKSDKLSKELEKTIKKIFKNYIKLHGSRDYFQVNIDGFVFEIVPILEIKKPEEAKNITDISPLHVNFVKKYTKLADEIRLLKKFCKANMLYGAESYISGFSGYVCELLIIYYGSFFKLVREVMKWKPKVIIDIKHYYKNKKDVLFNLNKSKTFSPLVIVDPVQKERNAAASLSYENFYKFIDVCKRFYKEPSKDFFVEKRITIDELKKKFKKNKLVVLEVKTKKGKIDIVGAKVRKIFEFIKRNISLNDFEIIDCGFYYDKEEKALIWFTIKKEKLSQFKDWKGPPLKEKSNVLSFKNKYKNTFIKGDRIYAKVKRKYVLVDDLVRDIIKNKYVLEKAREIKILV